MGGSGRGCPENFPCQDILWGFVVAWSKSEKTGDKEFIKGQQRAIMTTFDRKNGTTATTVPSTSTMAVVPIVTKSAGAIASTSAEAIASAVVGTSRLTVEAAMGPGAVMGVGVAMEAASATGVGLAMGLAIRVGLAKGATLAKGVALALTMAGAAAVHNPAPGPGTHPSPVEPSGSRPRQRGKARDMGPSVLAMPSLPVGGSGGRVRVVQSSSSGSEKEFKEEGETEVLESNADARTE
jgi:hypothetical protein